MNKIFNSTITVLLLLLFFACSENKPDTTNKQADSTIKKETVAKEELKTDSVKKTEAKGKKEAEQKATKPTKFICPLGCPKGKSGMKGLCPECQMELIENPDYKENGSKK